MVYVGCYCYCWNWHSTKQWDARWDPERFCLFTHTCVVHYTSWARTTVHSGEIKPTNESDNIIRIVHGIKRAMLKFSSVILWFGGAFIPFVSFASFASRCGRCYRFSIRKLLFYVLDCVTVCEHIFQISIVYVSIPVDGGVCVRWMLIAQQYCLAIRFAVCNDI